MSQVAQMNASSKFKLFYKVLIDGMLVNNLRILYRKTCFKRKHTWYLTKVDATYKIPI